MLITDVKRDELYRFECINNKIKTYPVNINTFAANVVNIGQALFDLESDINTTAVRIIVGTSANINTPNNSIKLMFSNKFIHFTSIIIIA